jgi:quercetin dioxygenase-like cupin family protein
MQFTVTGVLADGRSTVVETRRVLEDSIEWGDYSRSDRVWNTTQQPLELPVPRRRADEAIMELGVAEGATRWTMAEFKPETQGVWHRTDTLDYDVVIQGQVTLLLEAGEVVLGVGDSVMIPGVTHCWRGGPEGATMAVVLMGLPPVT